MLDHLESRARQAAARLPTSAAHWAVRAVHEESEQLSVRQDVTEAPSRALDDGAMVTVIDGGTRRQFEVHGGFADVTPAGLTILAEQASEVTAAA
jgi:predicted Zn-dependent protease